MKIKLIYTAIFLFSSFTIKAQGYIEFVENKGQWDSNILFNGQIGNGQFALTKNGYKVLQYDAAVMNKIGAHHHGVGNSGKHDDANEIIKGHVWDVNFLNCNKNAQVISSKKQQGYNNYFIGNNPAKWASDCKIYTELQYKNIYNNIDINYYTSSGTLKYDIIIKPGGNIENIQFNYNGIEKLSKNIKGDLVIPTSVGEFNELAPYTFQIIDGQKKQIDCSYKVQGNNLSFKIADYDKSQPLIIDPTVIFSTHSGSTADNWGFTATYGPDETFYGGGFVQAQGFPTTSGAFQNTWKGQTDMGIIKLNQNGSNRIYATYIGGASDEQPHSLICDPQGNLVIAGRTKSSDFPSTAVFGTRGGTDITITKLNATGTALIGSIIVAGSSDDGVNISETRARSSLQYNYGDDGRSEVNLDASGNIIVASCTQSNNFYTTTGVIQTNNNGGTNSQDAVFIKVNPTVSNVIFSTYFGGNGNDAAYVVNVNPTDGNIYFAGGTQSNNLQGTSGSVIQPTNAGSADGFITVINPAGTAIVRTTYLGTSSHDQIYGIQFDKNSFPYVMGISLGNWPVINAIYSNAGSHQFIAKLQKDLSAFVYSTKFGSNSNFTNISPVAFLVDKCDNVYVSGWGGDVYAGASNPSGPNFQNAGTTGMPITSDAIKSTTDGRDFYYFVLERNGVSQLFGSFFGGNQSSSQVGEHVDGGTSRFDPKGAIYQAACASCSGQQGSLTGGPGYTTTPGTWSENNASSNCNLGMTKIRFNLTGVGADLRASDTSGCVPLTVNFNDAFLNAVSYEFNFGDGSPTVAQTSPNATHIFNTPGFYRVRLIAIDLTSCNLRDTSYKTIRVRNDRATIGFNGVKQPPCLNLSYQFNNTSTAPAGKPFSSNSFTWDFDDGTGVANAGTASQLKTYASAGTYNVKLILKDTNYCNAPDTLVQQFRLSPTVKAQFEVINGCAPFTTTFKNQSLAGTSFEWVFGDGGTSTTTSPTYTYNNPGTFNIRLVANDPNTCNFTDTIIKTIVIHPTPVAGFTFSPTVAQINTPTQFTNTSTDATIYNWIFGDGDSSKLTNPLHQYLAKGTFNTCLYASNQFGCRDTVCLPVTALVEPLLDIPNAFTPNGDGNNDFIYVRGFGIKTIVWRIFNRWGQLVFETNQRNVGWDGKYKGQLQPMDAYSYTLNVEMTDGQKVKKSGDITLIR